MPASAAARSTAPARPARSARGAQRARSQHTPLPGRLVPLAVGGATGAVGGLADSGLVVRLTRGRLWIGLLAALLVGIVALNVMALSLNASSSKIADQAEGLKRANSALGARVAGKLSDQHVQQVAARLGLIVPEPGSIRYLRPSPGDAKTAAKRLASGKLTSSGIAPPTTAPAETGSEPTDAATTIAPAETAAPVTEETSTSAAEAPAAAPPPTSDTGGVPAETVP